MSSTHQHKLLALRRNKYDPDITEYWVDHRTHGKKGTEERDGFSDRAHTKGLAEGAHLNTNPIDDWDLRGAGVCTVEAGKDVTWMWNTWSFHKIVLHMTG